MAEEIKNNDVESVLNSDNQNLLLTFDSIYVFFIKSRKDKEKEFSVQKADGDQDINQERIDKLDSMNDVQVKDVQVYKFADFEFIQKLQSPKRSFILQIYNKNMTKDEMPYLQIECSKDEQFFILNHLIER